MLLIIRLTILILKSIGYIATTFEIIGVYLAKFIPNLYKNVKMIRMI